jgi:taurine--2-oxoglutarate transaminase
MIIETVIGTNGILPPPKGWLQGLRALLDKHGILLICDEVMCGFGRTGKMFAFEHGDIVPDILTMAKGLTSSYLPLGAMGVRDKIADHFQDNVFWGGLTYNAHALCLATAEAVLDVMVGGEAGRARRPHARRDARRDGRPQGQAPVVRDFRALGLFGSSSCRSAATAPPWPPTAALTPPSTS